MSGFRRRLDRLLRRGPIDAELQHHVDERTDWLVSRGWDGDAARREAERLLGNRTRWRGETMAVYRRGWEDVIVMSAFTLLGSIRAAARDLSRSPGFTVLAVGTLGLGLGASTAIFSVAKPILLDGLPYPDADRIVVIDDRSEDGAPIDVTFGSFREMLTRSRSFDALAATAEWHPTHASGSEPERLEGQRVTAGFLDVFGVTPALGRGFDPLEDRMGGSNVVILSDDLWRRRFAADEAVIGQEIQLDGDLHTVIGVMPAGFRNIMAPTAQIWTPLQYDSGLPPNGREWGHHLRMLARVGSGLDASAAAAELDQIARIPVAEFARPSWASMELGLSVRPLGETVVSQARPLLIIVIGAVALVLLVACTNVASLLLARAGQRRHEHVTRMALGASKRSVVGRVVTESMLISSLAGVVGLGLAQVGTRALLARRPPQLPRIDEIGVDGGTFLFVLTVVALLGVAVAAAPALSLSANTLTAGGGGRATDSHLRVRRILVVGEVALTVVVLVGAGLLIRSVQRLFDSDAGFDPSGTLVMQIHASGGALRGDEERNEFFRQALAEVQRRSGVTSAALTSQLPLSGDEDVYGVTLDGAGTFGFDERGGAYRYTITPEFFETMGMTLRSGRFLDARDGPGAPGAVMISESLARQSFPDGRAVGQRLHLGRTDVPPYTVAGVIADVRQNSLAALEETAVYVLRDQWYFTDAVAWLVVRTDRNPAALEPVVKDAVWSIDPNQPIARVATMEDLVAASEATRRFALVVFQTFALLMLALAAIGIYGVLAGGVAERTREIGIRTALGASDENILGLVVGQGLGMAGAGLLVGVLGAAAATRWMESLMFGISPFDPATHIGVAVLLGIIALFACWAPARRAARIDPAIAFKAE